MTDKYLELVNTGITKKIAAQLGLPRPAKLRRFEPGVPLIDQPVLVLGKGPDADTVATQLLDWNLDVRRHLGEKDKVGGIAVVLTEAKTPGDLSDTVLELGPALKAVKPGGRVIVFSRPANPEEDPATAATRQGITGMVRSLAHEMRAGATANGIQIAEGVPVDAPSSIAALHFLLSGRSAYVDGQFIQVSSAEGELPQDWDHPFTGQVAVVTGAARGIGATIARILTRDGARVILVDVPQAGEALAKVANEVRGTALQLDVTKPDAAAKILEHAQQRYGQLDIVIHNAGITRDKLLANMDAARWNSVIAVNIESQLAMNKVFLDSPIFAENGRIVSLASTSGIAGNRGQTNYATSKAGVIGMVAATAPEMATRGGSINAVAPGFIETDMTAKIPFLTREVARRLSSLQQGGLPVDVAETIGFLANNMAGGINGTTLRVCGQNLVGA